MSEVAEYFIMDIREKLKKIHPKLQEWLLENKPELVYIYEYYYQQAMNHPDPYIASEYAYRIFRTFVEITKHD
jgi:hypothetical protein